MHDFGRDLDRAMDAYVNRHYGSDCSHDCSDETEEKIKNLLKQEEKPMRKNRKTLTRWIGVIAACAVLMCSAVVVYAASPAVREYLNMLFLKEDSIARLTEVPEGYTGIYTAEDLDNVREDLYGNYILMNDIVLTEEDYLEGGIFEGGFVPIGDSQGDAFKGVFNGNGYVISGLVIDGGYSYAGLFGYVKRWHYSGSHMLNASNVDPTHIPYSDDTRRISGGVVKNLGVVDSVINIVHGTNVWPSEVNVGGIAGWADYAVGCYTENIEIAVEFSNEYDNIDAKINERKLKAVCVGGVVGGAYITDSCYSDADITVIGDAGTDEVLIAGVAGQSYACVTSYFAGTIDCGEYPDYGVSSALAYKLPVLLPESVLNEICDRLYEYEKAEGRLAEGETMAWEAKKMMAFYCEGSYIRHDMDHSAFFMNDVEDEPLYLLDPETKVREHLALSSIIDHAFPEGDFQQFCMENNLKCGYYYCYDLRETPDCTFEGFDTESIWYMADGRPQLRLFSGGTVGLSTESIGDRPRLGWQKGLFQTPIPGM